MFPQRQDIVNMELAIRVARNCLPEDSRKSRPKVGAVLDYNGQITAAYRGELNPGEHAEYTLLVRKLERRKVDGATMYTTLEPCTTRMHPKRPCWEWIVDAGISRIVIGMLDPNPEICGAGEWILKSNGLVVERFPSFLNAEIEKDNADFVEKQSSALLKKILRLRRYLVLEVPCANCGYKQQFNLRTSEWVANLPIDCVQCKKRFFVHLVGENGDFFTTRDGNKDYGLRPSEGLSLPNAIRRELRKRQGWIKPQELEGVLRLMKHFESELKMVTPLITPKQLMKAMVNADNLVRYKVSTQSIRCFFRFIVLAKYFISEQPGQSIWNTPYTNSFNEELAIRLYLSRCLLILKKAQVVSKVEDAVAVCSFLLKDVTCDPITVAYKLWNEYFAQHSH